MRFPDIPGFYCRTVDFARTASIADRRGDQTMVFVLRFPVGSDCLSEVALQVDTAIQHHDGGCLSVHQSFPSGDT